MLKRIDISLPEWAMEINDLVSIEDKVHWAENIVPTLVRKLESDPTEATEWLQSQLDSEALSLLQPGVATLAETWEEKGDELLACFES